MIADAFEYSEKYQTPVLFRPTTRVCHACVSIDLLPKLDVPEPEGFIKDTMRWVIFPRLSYQNHIKIEARNVELSEVFSSYDKNLRREGKGRKGVVSGGVSFAYTSEVIPEDAPLLKISTPHPFPERLAKEFMEDLDEVLVLEELDPVIEKELLQIVGKYHLNVKICGKLTHDTKNAGENSVESIRGDLERFLGTEETDSKELCGARGDIPQLPVRPPVLCAGCPHRASFYAVKKAMRGKKAVFSGDIGCYTLGNAKPLDMVDTCLCMGADVTIAQGLHIIEPDAVNFAFIGDSTFFASGITGVVNAVYNQTDIVLIVLDNSTTAMTGHQPSPGRDASLPQAPGTPPLTSIDMEAVIRALGVEHIQTVRPTNLKKVAEATRAALDHDGVSVIICREPCPLHMRRLSKAKKPVFGIDGERCVNCHTCVDTFGCPAFQLRDGKVSIDPVQCIGCAVCAQVCPNNAIRPQK